MMSYLFWAIIILIMVVLIYFGVGTVAALTMTKVGDHPQYDENPGTFGLAFEPVRFRSRGDQLQIAGWYIPNPGVMKAIILVHGRDASKQNAISGKFPELAAEINKAGFAVLMIDLRGHGESEGKRYTFGVQERWDVLGAVDFLIEQGFEPGQIAALGISLGGAAVIGAAAAEQAIGAVVLESTFADIHALIKPHWKAESGLPMFFLPGVFYMWQVLFGNDLRKVKPAEWLKSVPPRSILILHSRSDEMVDYQQALALKKSVPEAELCVLDGPSHAELFRDNPRVYLAALIPFLEKFSGKEKQIMGNITRIHKTQRD